MKGGDLMPLRWRLNPLELLIANGYSTYRLRKEKIVAQSTIAKLKAEKPVPWENIELVCRLTGKSPGKLIEYVKDD